MPLDANKYQKLKSLLASGELSDEVRAQAEAAISEFEEAPAADPEGAKAERIAQSLDPSLPVPPQLFAAQPATTHPGGEEAAKEQWVQRGGPDAESLFVYEPPVEQARQKMLSDPQLVKALFPDGEIPPEWIESMDDSSDLYKAYADYEWGKVASSAKEAGKTAYRVSEMPWLKGDAAGLSPLATFLTKARSMVTPLQEQAQSFILGASDMATFGLAPKIQAGIAETVAESPVGEALRGASKAVGDVIRGGEAVGGMQGAIDEGQAPRETIEQLQQENPLASGAGAVTGLFLGAPGKVFNALSKGGAAVASRVAGPGAGAVAKTAARVGVAAPVGALGAGAIEAGRGAVETGAEAVESGELPSGEELQEIGQRAEVAALDPTNLALSVGGEALGALAGGTAKMIANSPRWKGNIQRLETLGGKVKLGKGPQGTPRVEDAIERGKTKDRDPVELMAEDIGPDIEKVEDEAVRAVRKEVGEAKKAFYATGEGQAALPLSELVSEEVGQLRALRDKAGRGIGVTPEGRKLTRHLDADIEAVSLEPVEGAIELTAKEAEDFLSASRLRKLLPGDPSSGPPPSGGGPSSTPPPAGGGGRNRQGVNVLRPEAAPSGAAPTPVDDMEGFVSVPPPPGRRDAPTIQSPGGGREVTRGQQEALELEPLREARAPMQREARRMEKLSAEMDDPASLLMKSMLGAGAGAGLAAAAGEDESGAAMAGAGAAVLGARAKLPPGVLRALDQVARRTAGAVKRLTAEEKAAISQWSSSSRQTKAAYERLGRTGEENIARLQKRGFQPDEIDRSMARAAKRGERPYAEQGDAETVRALSGAIDKLAIDNPTQYGSLHRGFAAGDDMYEMPEISDLLTKDTFVNKTPISTSYNANAAKDFTSGAWVHEEQTPVLLEFTKVRRAAPRVHPDIQTLGEGARLREAEVLIPPGSTFRVVKRVERDMPGPYEGAGSKKGMVITLEQIDDAPREAWKDAAMIGAMLGLGEATGEEEAAAAGAAAGGLGFARRLLQKGRNKVYVVPRRLNARETEVRLNQVRRLGKEPEGAMQRAAAKLQEAVMRDRSKRTLGGQPGGWSALQREHAQKIGAVKRERQLTAPEGGRDLGAGERALKPLTKYASQTRGEGPRVRAMESAAEKAGVSDRLPELRMVDPLLELRHSMQLRRPGTVMPTSGPGLIGSTIDHAALRLLYPTLAPAGVPMRGGTLGPKLLQLRERRDEE